MASLFIGRHLPAPGLGLGLAGALGMWGAGGWQWSAASVAGAAALVVAGAWSDHRRRRRDAHDHGTKAAFVAGTDQLGQDLLPVWSAQIENSRAQMEDAIAGLTRHFVGVMERLGLLQQGSAPDGMRGLAGLFEHSLELSSLLDALESMRDGELGDHPLLERVQGLALAVESCVGSLMHESAAIQSDLGQALVHLQFQDRVSQRMMHVRHSIERIPAVLSDKRRHFDHTGKLEPVDIGALLAELRGSYSMADEHAVHAPGRSVAAAQASEVTLF